MKFRKNDNQLKSFSNNQKFLSCRILEEIDEAVGRLEDIEEVVEEIAENSPKKAKRNDKKHPRSC